MTAQLALTIEPDEPGMYHVCGITPNRSAGFAYPAAWFASRAHALEAAQRQVAVTHQHYPDDIARMTYSIELVQACERPDRKATA